MEEDPGEAETEGEVKKVTEYVGQVIGRTKKDAMFKAKRLYGPLPKGQRFHLEYLYRDPPFTVYELTVESTAMKPVRSSKKGRQ